MALKFCIPQTDQPTCYLFVGNCGPKVGLDKDDVFRLFEPFGCIAVEITEPQKSYLFVCFSEESQATAAMHYFSEEDTSRRFVVRYADVKKTRNRQSATAPLHRDAAACQIPGLDMIKEFISEQEESSLLELVERRDLNWEVHAGRSVLHFGTKFDYATRNVSRETISEFPEILLPVVERMEAISGIPKLDQLTINGYPPGVGFASHIDTHSAFTGAIVSLSTGNATVMQFRKGDEKKRLLIPRCALLVMDGESRYCWQHYIPANRVEREDATRYSFTFRQARGYPCRCPYPDYCDSQLGALPPTRLLQRQYLQELLERDYVHSVYDIIARHFSSTRFAVWPKVRAFIESLAPYSLVADVGCGNGKYFNVRKDVAVLGFDRSEGLLKAAMAKHYPVGIPCTGRGVADVGLADGMKLPLRDQTCDASLCVAVLHHISSIERRLIVLNEVVRILRPGGLALVTVWAQEQEDLEKTISKWKPIPSQDPPEEIKEMVGGVQGNDYLVPWHLPLHRPEGQAAAQEAGSIVDREKGTVIFHRYYHLYVEGELERLVSHVSQSEIVDSFYDKSNWCTVIRRSS